MFILLVQSCCIHLYFRYGGTGSSPTFEALAGSSNVPTFGALSQQQSPGGGFGGGGGGGGGFGSTQQQPGKYN